jgi:transcriptional regulator with GAF, ATPase, and Fis domain
MASTPFSLALRLFRRFTFSFSRRWLLVIAGILVCLYAVTVLLYVQTIPDLGLRSIFSRVIKGEPRVLPDADFPKPFERPKEGDEVLKVGDISIQTWTDLLRAPSSLRDKIRSSNSGLPPWAMKYRDLLLVEAEFERPESDGARVFKTWLVLGGLPLEELVPSVSWFCLKLMLFLVGALVLWKRPTDMAAVLFFLLCIVTLGAYMGGYHWPYIATQPALLLVFMVCAVTLPVVSLHFYLYFPRPKGWLVSHPGRSLLLIYGPPSVFLVALVVLYFHLFAVVRSTDLRDRSASIVQALGLIRVVATSYLLFASGLYLASVASLVHSFRTVADVMERKQVQWILIGAVLALVPIGYSLYLVVLNPDAFGRGETTWPMFAASVCLTVAFAISITRYRLMELDQIISSGMMYFFISFLAVVVYYGIVGVTLLFFDHRPRISGAVTVGTTALVLMLVLNLARRRLMRALDRRYSRDKSQLDLTLQELGRAVQQLVDPPALAKRLLQASTELLGAYRGSVFLRQGEPALFHLTGSVGDAPPLTELATGCPLIEAVEGGKAVGARARAGWPPTPAQRQLHFLGGDLAQPLIHEGTLRALLILGPKGSAYRQEDLDLLAAFAQITVLALGSAEGHRTIELLNRDLQTKVEKISEQQRRILALQSQLRRQKTEDVPPAASDRPSPAEGAAAPAELPAGMVGSGPVVCQLLHLVKKVASTDAVVLIRGESGTGKELLARAVHDMSERAGKTFVKVHCAALAPGLLESELFGHVKGAFTDAHRDKIGRFELANGGTLFLDEIGDISLEVQTKLLRVLQEKAFERVGSSDPVSVNVRIITATHQDLENLIRQGRFREDLFYRLNVFPILVPPLRDRSDDIVELAVHFIRLSCQRCRKEALQIDDDVLALLKSYSWPGNIRQLENVIERAVVVAEGPAITVPDLPPDLLLSLNGNAAHATVASTAASSVASSAANGKGWAFDRDERVRQEREYLVRALAAADGNKAEAARALGVARSTLVSRLKKLGLS